MLERQAWRISEDGENGSDLKGLVVRRKPFEIFDIVNGFLIDAVAHWVRTPDFDAYTTDVESG